MNQLAIRGVSRSAVMVGLPMALVLFAVQLGLFGLVDTVPSSTLFASPAALPLARLVVSADLTSLALVTSPVAALAFALARLARTMLPLPLRPSPVSLVAVWVSVFFGCWLALFVVFGGTNPARWSGALLAAPAFWYPLGFASVALYYGAK